MEKFPMIGKKIRAAGDVAKALIKRDKSLAKGLKFTAYGTAVEDPVTYMYRRALAKRVGK